MGILQSYTRKRETKNENLNRLQVISRYVAPTDFIFKIQSFSSLGWTTKKVESRIFESGGYKWRLSLTSSGSKKQGVGDHISLYLSLADTDKLPSGWEVLINFKFFIFNQIKNEYLSLQDVDGKVCRFHCLKTEWRYDQLLPMATFIDPTNGYLVEDSCAFGAEIYVIKPNNATFESLDSSKTIDNPIFTWKINDFSGSKTKLSSPEFIIGGRKWKLILYPNGSGPQVGKSLSLYLALMDFESLGKSQLEAKFKLRIIDQVSREKNELEANVKFCSSISGNSWGFYGFMSLKNLNDATKKYVLDNTVLVEVEFCLLKISDAPAYSAAR